MTPIHGLAGFGGGVASKLSSGGAGGGGGSLTFDYHMFGNNIGDLEVYVYDTSASSLIGPFSMTYDDGNSTGTVISGQQQTTQSGAWKNAVADLAGTGGKTGYLAFKYRPGTQGTSYMADAALDSMSLTTSNGTVVDLDPNLERYGTHNWQSARYQNQTDDTFPQDNSGKYINYSPNNYIWIDTPKNSGTAYMGQYEDGGTPSGSTGPVQDSDGSTTNYYIYFETSSSNATYTAWLRTKSQYTF